MKKRRFWVVLLVVEAVLFVASYAIGIAVDLHLAAELADSGHKGHGAPVCMLLFPAGVFLASAVVDLIILFIRYLPKLFERSNTRATKDNKESDLELWDKNGNLK
ncbi:MAG: hypothetical protein K6F63_06835 [Lachnospiraceae bacterium]|nr:hypothetical protein [Lachnospiraceae bacterium]